MRSCVSYGTSALAALVETGDEDLAAALRVEADREAERNVDLDGDELSSSLLGVVAAMAELRAAGPAAGRRVPSGSSPRWRR